MKSKQRHRLVIDLTPEQKESLNKIFKHGELNPFFSIIVDDVISAVNNNGRKVLGAYISRRIQPEHISKLMEQ